MVQKTGINFNFVYRLMARIPESKPALEQKKRNKTKSAATAEQTKRAYFDKQKGFTTRFHQSFAWKAVSI